MRNDNKLSDEENKIIEKYDDVFDAVFDDNFEAVEAFLKKDPSLLHAYTSEKIEEKTSLIGLTVLENNNSLFQLLVDKGANLHETFEYNGQTLLHDAAENKNLSTFQTLIHHGLDIHAKDNDGNTILHLASQQNNINTVKYIVEKLDSGLLAIENNEGKIPIELIKSSKNTLKNKEVAEKLTSYMKPLTEIAVKEKLSKEVDLIDNTVNKKRKPKLS